MGGEGGGGREGTGMKGREGKRERKEEGRHHRQQKSWLQACVDCNHRISSAWAAQSESVGDNVPHFWDHRGTGEVGYKGWSNENDLCFYVQQVRQDRRVNHWYGMI